MPDGARSSASRARSTGRKARFGERPRRTALLLGCDIAFRDQIVYGAALPVGNAARATPIGPACRLCERAGCLARAEPPVTRPLGLDEMVTGLSAFDFQYAWRQRSPIIVGTSRRPSTTKAIDYNFGDFAVPIERKVVADDQRAVARWL